MPHCWSGDARAPLDAGVDAATLAGSIHSTRGSLGPPIQKGRSATGKTRFDEEYVSISATSRRGMAAAVAFKVCA